MAEWSVEAQGEFSTLGQGLYTLSGNRESALMDQVVGLQAQVKALVQQLNAALPASVDVGSGPKGV